MASVGSPPVPPAPHATTIAMMNKALEIGSSPRKKLSSFVNRWISLLQRTRMNLGDGGTVFACDPRRERYAGYNLGSAEGAEFLAGSFAGYVDNVALQLAGSGPLHLENDSAGDDDLPDSVVASVAETGELDQHDHSGAETAHATAVIGE